MAAAGSIGFSGKAILAKLMYRHGVDAVQVIFWRMLLALPLFLALAWWAGRGKPALGVRDWRTIALLGFCGYYLASFLDFAGLQRVVETGRMTPLSQLVPAARDLEIVVHKAIRPEPEQRYASAAAFADDLQAFLEHRPVSARPLTRWQRCHR